MTRDLFKKLFPFYCAVLAITIALAFLLNQTVTTYTDQNVTISEGMCIIIDPGHGLPDGGTTSCTGVLESDLNLQISIRLNDLFHLFGVKTIVTRVNQDSIYTEGDSIARKKVSDTKNRVSLINNTKNAILLSIHQNHFYDSRYSGAQVFYAGTKGSDLLAKKLQADLVTNLNPGSNRQSKRSSGVYLMENIRCTGVLIECGFLSNIQEESRLRSAQYQKKLCSVIVISCAEYLNQYASS